MRNANSSNSINMTAQVYGTSAIVKYIL